VVDLHPPRRVRRLGGDWGRDSAYDPGRFIAAALWRFSETMPEIPHEYTVRAWRRTRTSTRSCARCTSSATSACSTSAGTRCLEVGGWHYLVQGTGTGDTSIIRRARLDGKG
jgi:hypothetical protein